MRDEFVVPAMVDYNSWRKHEAGGVGFVLLFSRYRSVPVCRMRKSPARRTSRYNGRRVRRRWLSGVVLQRLVA